MLNRQHIIDLQPDDQYLYDFGKGWFESQFVHMSGMQAGVGGLFHLNE
jgi:hypothetical protein